MNITCQDLFALAIVAAAVGFVGRTVYRMLFGGKAACGGCGSCPSSASATPPLVSLELTGENPAAAKRTSPGERQ